MTLSDCVPNAMGSDYCFSRLSALIVITDGGQSLKLAVIGGHH